MWSPSTKQAKCTFFCRGNHRWRTRSTDGPWTVCGPGTWTCRELRRQWSCCPSTWTFLVHLCNVPSVVGLFTSDTRQVTVLRRNDNSRDCPARKSVDGWTVIAGTCAVLPRGGRLAGVFRKFQNNSMNHAIFRLLFLRPSNLGQKMRKNESKSHGVSSKYQSTKFAQIIKLRQMLRLLSFIASFAKFQIWFENLCKLWDS